MVNNSPREIKIKTHINGVEVDREQSEVPVRIIGDRVLIKPFEPEKMLSEAANIIKPVDMKEPYRKGTIVSVGGGEYGTSLPTHLKTGLVVNYYHQTEVDFTVDKEVFKLVRASDIFAYL